MTHELKINPESFAAIRDDKKTFEIQQCPPEYEEGDVLLLREFDAKTQIYSGEWVSAGVSYIQRDYAGISDGYCVMSIHVYSYGNDYKGLQEEKDFWS